MTLVDNVHNPSRLYGTTQFMGVGAVDLDAKNYGKDDDKDDDDDDDDHDGDGDADCGGLCYAQGDTFIAVPLATHFPDAASFPFFVQPYVLNSQDPTKLVFWVNGTFSTPTKQPAGFYQFDIPAEVTRGADIKAPSLVLKTPVDSFFLDFISGGHTDGKPDPALIVGISTTDLYVRDPIIV